MSNSVPLKSSSDARSAGPTLVYIPNLNTKAGSPTSGSNANLVSVDAVFQLTSIGPPSSTSGTRDPKPACRREEKTMAYVSKWRIEIEDIRGTWVFVVMLGKSKEGTGSADDIDTCMEMAKESYLDCIKYKTNS